MLPVNHVRPSRRITRKTKPASVQGLMVCVYESNLDLVRSRRKTSDDERPAAGFGPDPRRAINRDMEMPDAGRHIERIRAKHRDDL